VVHAFGGKYKAQEHAYRKERFFVKKKQMYIIIPFLLLLFGQTASAHSPQYGGPYDTWADPEGIAIIPEAVEYDDNFQEDNLADLRSRSATGWVLRSNHWYFYRAGVRQTGWIQDGPNMVFS